VQHTQLNVVKRVFQGAGVLIFLVLPALAAGTIVQPSKPDPLLDGGPTTACAAGPDYAAGTDIHGRDIASADVAAAPVPVPDAIAIPLAQAGSRGGVRPGMGDSSYVSLDGRKLAPLLNPVPCH
jgi:hypothetical protein